MHRPWPGHLSHVCEHTCLSAALSNHPTLAIAFQQALQGLLRQKTSEPQAQAKLPERADLSLLPCFSVSPLLFCFTREHISSFFGEFLNLKESTSQVGKMAWERLLSLKDASDPGIEPRSLTSQAGSLPSEPPGKPWPTMLWVKLYFL